MTSAKEQHTKELLLQDPAYAAAWQDVRAALTVLDITDPDAAAETVSIVLQKFADFLDTRPDLVALIEAAERETQ